MVGWFEYSCPARRPLIPSAIDIPAGVGGGAASDWREQRTREGSPRKLGDADKWGASGLAAGATTVSSLR